ncbi:hypothetical protein H920_10154 [Fukomys damarensis]|uniref:Uncharacterized protein n=1 Tax=Fukomys damarensis TaxID=885580 RepID=A0A091DCU5_FUKDA|nr:hypothetical protein H920_10154 [Fukomys damarensis]
MHGRAPHLDSGTRAARSHRRPPRSPGPDCEVHDTPGTREPWSNSGTASSQAVSLMALGLDDILILLDPGIPVSPHQEHLSNQTVRGKATSQSPLNARFQARCLAHPCLLRNRA